MGESYYISDSGPLNGYTQKKHGRPSHHPLLTVLAGAHFIRVACKKVKFPGWTSMS
jgi:hypothetical protein